MGHRLSATVFYGFDLGGSEDRTEEQYLALPAWWRDEREWEDVLAETLGWRDIPYPRELDPRHNRDAAFDPWGSHTQPVIQEFEATSEYRAWSENMAYKRALIKEFDVHIDLYGYEMDNACVSVTESEQGCDYGAEKISTIFAPTTKINEWNGKITRFASALDIIIPPGAVGWHISATWA